MPLGGASAAGIKLGERDREDAEKVLGTTIFWIIIIDLSLTALILLNLTSILEILGASKNNISYAYIYYAYIIPTLVFQLGSCPSMLLSEQRGIPCCP